MFGSIWRILVFVAALLLSVFALQLVVYPVAGFIARLLGTSITLYPWVTLGGAILAHIFCLNRLDRQPWESVGLGRNSVRAAPLLLAFGAGLLAVAVPVLLLVGLDWYRFEAVDSGGWLRVAGGSLLFFLPAAASEELVVHGYVFSVLRQRHGWRAALLSTSIAFGLLHYANPDPTVQSIAIVVGAGLFIGMVFLWTNSLPVAIMLHVAWNWTLVALFHAPVSGLVFETPGYRLTETGPDLVTGGTWGPEGGLAALCGMLLGLWIMSRQRPAPEEAASHANTMGNPQPR